MTKSLARMSYRELQQLSMRVDKAMATARDRDSDDVAAEDGIRRL